MAFAEGTCNMRVNRVITENSFCRLAKVYYLRDCQLVPGKYPIAYNNNSPLTTRLWLPKKRTMKLCLCHIRAGVPRLHKQKRGGSLILKSKSRLKSTEKKKTKLYKGYLPVDRSNFNQSMSAAQLGQSRRITPLLAMRRQKQGEFALSYPLRKSKNLGRSALRRSRFHRATSHHLFPGSPKRHWLHSRGSNTEMVPRKRYDGDCD